MKKPLIFFSLCALVCMSVTACGEVPIPLPEESLVLDNASKYDNYYYDINGEEVALTKTDAQSYILFRDNDESVVSEKIAAISAEIEQTSTLNMSVFENPYEHFTNCSWAIVSASEDELSSIVEIIYVTSFYTHHGVEDLGVSPFVIITLKSENDLPALKKLAEDNTLLFLGNNRIITEQYMLACTKESTGNALQIANWLHEMELFESVYPDLLVRVEPIR